MMTATGAEVYDKDGGGRAADKVMTDVRILIRGIL